MEDWTEKYDYPMSEDFWRDAIRLHTGNDPYSSNAINAEFLKEMKEIRFLIEELILELRAFRESKQEKSHIIKEKPSKKSKGVEL